LISLAFNSVQVLHSARRGHTPFEDDAMAKTRSGSFTILIATDGSDEGTAAVHATAAGPWPPGARVHGVVVRSAVVATEMPAFVLADVERGLGAVAGEAGKILARRWPGAEVRVVDGPVVDAILREAQRVRARVIVLGSRGHGPIARLLLGSTSLGVVRRMNHAALVVRGPARGFTRMTLGFDGSPAARRAVVFLAGLQAPSGARVTIVRVLESARPTSLALLPAATRKALLAEMAAVHAAAEKKASRECEAAAVELRRAGFEVTVVVRAGAPLDELLGAATRARAQLLVVGARGHSPVERLLLGSVAEGALHRSSVSVLVTR
jgi:nucleotide-binding universal stress UspA family protein